MRYMVTDKDILVQTDTYLVDLKCEDGTVMEQLEPRRLFPYTNPTQYISLLNPEGVEVAMISDLLKLAPDSKQAVLDCFKEYYRIPRVTKILNVYDRFGSLRWTVETDRGEVLIRIQNRHNDIKPLSDTLLFVRDSNDNRYLVDLTKLDKSSLHKIFIYV